MQFGVLGPLLVQDTRGPVQLASGKQRALLAIRLEGLCAVAQEERMELELARGGGAELVPELEALIAGDPYREHMHGLLMLALYRAGRQADALEIFQRARQSLTHDLGLEPGP